MDGDAMAAQAPAFLTESPVPAFGEPWRDPDRPVDERVDDLLARLSLPEKIGQLYGGWVGVPSGGRYQSIRCGPNASRTFPRFS